MCIRATLPFSSSTTFHELHLLPGEATCVWSSILGSRRIEGHTVVIMLGWLHVGVRRIIVGSRSMAWWMVRLGVGWDGMRCHRLGCSIGCLLVHWIGSGLHGS